MTKSLLAWTILSLLCLAVSASSAAELEVEADLSLEVATAYVWRGQVLTDRGVLFPDVRLDTSTGLWFDTWGALDLSSENGPDYDGNFEEVDLTIGYALPLGEDSRLAVDLGLVQYLFPVAGGSTREVFAGASYVFDLADGIVLVPGASIYWDVDETGGDAVYGTVGSDLVVDIGSGLGLTTGVALGIANGAYNRFYFGPDLEGIENPIEIARREALDDDLDSVKLNDLRFSANVDYAVSEALAIGLNGSYGFLPDDDIADAAKLAFDDDEQFYGGAYVTVHLN